MKNIGYKESSLGTGNNDFSITLGKDFTLMEVNLSVPGGVGDITYRLYDGIVADGKPITDTLYLSATGKVELNKKITDTDGKLGIRVAGRTSGGSKCFVNVRYSF